MEESARLEPGRKNEKCKQRKDMLQRGRIRAEREEMERQELTEDGYNRGQKGQ